eukprot:COSAG06_NODE_2876_length_6144_cov_6.898263_2_plen_168_part_00
MVVSARFVPADTKAVPRVGESLLRSPERCCNLAVARRVHSYGGYGGACLIHPREAPATPCAGSNSAATQLYCSPRGEAPPAAYSEVRSTLNSSEREHRRAQGGREGGREGGQPLLVAILYCPTSRSCVTLGGWGAQGKVWTLHAPTSWRRPFRWFPDLCSIWAPRDA